MSQSNAYGEYNQDLDLIQSSEEDMEHSLLVHYILPFNFFFRTSLIISYPECSPPPQKKDPILTNEIARRGNSRRKTDCFAIYLQRCDLKEMKPHFASTITGALISPTYDQDWGIFHFDCLYPYCINVYRRNAGKASPMGIAL